MADGDVFGPILPGSVIEERVSVLLQAWMPTYLKSITDMWDLPDYPDVRSWNKRPEGETWPADQLPGIVVICAGLDGSPVKSGDGQYEAPVRVGVACFAQGRTQDEARRNSSLYVAAARAILLQKRGLDGLSSNVEWVAESYHEGPPDQQRTLAGAVSEFVFQIYGWVNKNGGPSEPLIPPGTLLSTVEHPDLEVTRLS